MKKNVGVSMLVIALLALSGVIYTFVTDTKPTLGLDLAGGVSVVMDLYIDGKLQEDVPQDNLDKTIDIIRKRVDAIGVAEPEISSQGSSILVQIPGIEDQDRALELMGRTAELRFRPVLSTTQSVPSDPERIAELRESLKIPEGVTAAEIVKAETGIDPDAPPTTAAPSTTAPSLAPTIPPSTAAASTTAATTASSAASTTAPAGDAAGTRHIAGRFGAALPTQDPATSTATTAPASSTTTPAASTTTAPTGAAPATTAAGATTTTTIKNKWGVDINSEEFLELYQAEAAAKASEDITKPEDDKANETVTLPDEAGEVLYKLGPVYEADGHRLTGTALSGADAGLGGSMGTEWAVFPEFKSGKAGIDLFNAAAQQCYNGEPECPAQAGAPVGQLAITLDGEVLTAPLINQDDKEAGMAFQPYKSGKSGLQISGAFTEQSANDVSTALKFGALPYELRPSSAQEVSATLGAGALKAALIAGAVGLALVAAYMLFYYRVLGVVTIFGLSISGGILWTFISLIGASLTLSGIVGIIVSIGISLDSNVVFFENLKEDVRGGRTLRSTVSRSFSSAYSTIVKADISSLIGAGVLFALTAGPVKGFAAYLFLTTAIDLVVSWFWMRPATTALAYSSLGNNPAAFGIPVNAPVTRRQRTGSASGPVSGSPPVLSDPPGAKVDGVSTVDAPTEEEGRAATDDEATDAREVTS